MVFHSLDRNMFELKACRVVYAVALWFKSFLRVCKVGIIAVFCHFIYCFYLKL